MTRNFKGKKIAVSICEDIWNVNSDLHAQNPLELISTEKPDLYEFIRKSMASKKTKN